VLSSPSPLRSQSSTYLLAALFATTYFGSIHYTKHAQRRRRDTETTQTFGFGASAFDPFGHLQRSRGLLSREFHAGLACGVRAGCCGMQQRCVQTPIGLHRDYSIATVSVGIVITRALTPPSLLLDFSTNSLPIARARVPSSIEILNLPLSRTPNIGRQRLSLRRKHSQLGASLCYQDNKVRRSEVPGTVRDSSADVAIAPLIAVSIIPDIIA
jgi:hypothetical protein